MSSLFTRSVRGIGLVAFVAAGAAALSCSKDETTGQLTIVIQTDLAMPKDLDYVRLEVRSDGLPLGTENPPPLHRNDYPINPADAPEVRVTIPATFAVYNAKGAVQPVAVRVIAGRGVQARILRDAITAVPSDRNAMLRMNLQWISDGSALPAPAGSDPHQAVNACPALQTNIAGQCVDSHVDLASLPEFSNVSIFGGASPTEGHAFDVLSCFAAPEPVATDAACSFALPAGVAPENVNVGIELPPASDGVCNAAHCVVPLDKQESLTAPGLGWFLLAGRIQLPPGVCARAATVPAMKVVFARECSSKTAAMPLCSPSSSVTDCSIRGAQDGGAQGSAVNTLSLGRFHSCRRNGPNAVCWGNNSSLQSGPGNSNTGDAMPKSTLVGTATSKGPVISIAAGVDSTCAVRDGVYCWGNNRYGQRGQTPPIDDNVFVPKVVPGGGSPPRIVAASSSGTESHACASGSGDTFCWGANSAKQLGTAVANGISTPLPFEAQVLALGDRFSCALVTSSGGKVACWGANELGQLGIGAPTPDEIWVKDRYVIDIPAARDVVAGKDFACALTVTNEVWCWGSTLSGVVSGTRAPGLRTPAKSNLVDPVKNLAAGVDFACATVVSFPERITCWGDNSSGQLGDADVNVVQNNVTVPIQAPFDQIVAGGQRACVISGSRVACWGANEYGQISGTPSTPLAPMESLFFTP